MYISVTGLNKWVGNKEEYRLCYLALGHGVVPEEKDEYLDRGTSMHTWIEGWAKKWTNDEIVAKLQEEGIKEPLIDRGYEMNVTLQAYLNSNKIEVIESEFEFEIPIEGKLGSHSLVGKVDGIGRDDMDHLFVVEYKGTSKLKLAKELEKEWRVAKQADTEILGARAKGYPDINSLLVIYVDEDGRTAHLPVYRSEYQLEYTLQSIAQECDMITMMLDKWGSETPWPHNFPSIWSSDMRGRCNSDSDTFTCAYKDICGSRLACIPEGFKAREEYLEILKVKVKA